MSSIMHFSTGLMIFIYLCTCLIIAIFTAWVASQKERNVTAWFFLGFFFGIFAFFAVGLAPKRNDSSVRYLAEIYSFIKNGNSDSELRNEIPVVHNSGNTWYCKKCGTTNNIAEISCKDCGAYK